MSIREFFRDVRDRFRDPDDYAARHWPRHADDDDRSRPWPRDEGYDEYRERGIGAGSGIGGPEITSGFFDIDRPEAGGFVREPRRERPNHRGRGPIGFRRTDERIREDVCETLMEDEDLDASEIEVTVTEGEVTLTGTVASRLDKRYAEDLTANVSGVRDVNNMLRMELQ